MHLYINILFIVILIYISNSFKEECISSAYPPEKKNSVKTFQINLDLPPKDRWNQVILEKRQHLAELFRSFKSFVLNFGHVAKIIINYIDNDIERLTDTMPYGYGNEMRGISEISGVPLGEIVVFNIFYELFSACTSIVANSGNGQIYHARNLDFGLFMGWKNHSWQITQALKPLIVNLEFIQNQHVVYQTVSFAGYVGIFTGLKKNAFTITLNERFSSDGGFLGLIEWIGGKRDIHWSSLLIRQILEKSSTYDEAKEILKTTPLLASTYFILGGNNTGQASIITRTREKELDTWDIGTKHSKWFLLETNYDNWKQPLFIDDRRTPAMRCLNDKGFQNMNFDSLYNVLSSRPVLNKLTVYTSLLQVNSGEIETYIQDCPDPCSPW